MSRAASMAGLAGLVTAALVVACQTVVPSPAVGTVSATQGALAAPAAPTPLPVARPSATAGAASAPLPASGATPMPAFQCLNAPGFGAQPPFGAGGFPGQSNSVPQGYPTPNSWAERLVPGGPARDPGPFDWHRPGPYLPAARAPVALDSFGAQQRLATTYYFYWHDYTQPGRRARIESGAVAGPPNADWYSFMLPETHLKEFSDMIAAGLDFALPVYWGEPGHPGRTTSETCPRYWSTDGIGPMVEALTRLEAQGIPFKIGLFYDTTILANADLTTPAGKEYFYLGLRGWFSRVPPRFWAAIDGKPIVWLYDTLWVAGYDQSTFDYAADRFAQDFGGHRPYLFREYSWRVSKTGGRETVLQSDGFYGWGAAPFGFNEDREFSVAQVGPGFKNTSFCTGGAERNCFDTPRQGGAWYEQQLALAIASGRRLLAVETWNEFSEGTEVQETTRDGRFYIDLTRRFVDLFKRP